VLTLPRPPAAQEAVWLSVRVGVLQRGARVLVLSDDGTRLGAISPFAIPPGKEAGTYTIPLPQNFVRDGRVVVRLVVEEREHATRPATGGEVEEVSEVEIAAAKAEIGADGIGCEPASAVTLAGLKKLRRSGFVKSGEAVVLILTGHLLKDPDFTIKFHRGDLFAGTSGEIEAAPAKYLQRAPVVLDADLGAVIAVLDAAERNSK